MAQPCGPATARGLHTWGAAPGIREGSICSHCCRSGSRPGTPQGCRQVNWTCTRVVGRIYIWTNATINFHPAQHVTQHSTAQRNPACRIASAWPPTLPLNTHGPNPARLTRSTASAVQDAAGSHKRHWTMLWRGEHVVGGACSLAARGHACRCCARKSGV